MQLRSEFSLAGLSGLNSKTMSYSSVCVTQVLADNVINRHWMFYAWFYLWHQRRGSAVITSIFNWRIFPDLWLTCDHFVGNVSAMGQTTRPIQLSIPLGLVIE